jgi:hypothetical protein
MLQVLFWANSRTDFLGVIDASDFTESFPLQEEEGN